MSNKDSWDDESSDEEELPTDPLLKDGGLLRFNLDTGNSAASEVPVESEAPTESDTAEIIENEEEYPPEESDYTQEEWGGEGDLEDDYDDDYDDEIDKKLGRYVSCR